MRRERGFTLLEVVIALAILASGIVLVQRLHARAALAARGAELRESAVRVAEARLAEFHALAAPAPGVSAGVAPGDIRWVRRASAFAEPIATGHRLWRVVVVASPPAGAPVRLESLRLAVRPR